MSVYNLILKLLCH